MGWDGMGWSWGACIVSSGCRQRRAAGDTDRVGELRLPIECRYEWLTGSEGDIHEGTYVKVESHEVSCKFRGYVGRSGSHGYLLPSYLNLPYLSRIGLSHEFTARRPVQVHTRTSTRLGGAVRPVT